MQLPDDVVNIIREYSKPLTRADWRHCGKLTQSTFNTELKKHIIHEHLFYRSMYTLQIKHMRFWFFTTTYREKNNYIEQTSLLII